MSESLRKGASVTSVSATDNDLGVNARLTYTLAERDREYFYVTTVDATNTGVIKVFKVRTTTAVSLIVIDLKISLQRQTKLNGT